MELVVGTLYKVRVISSPYFRDPEMLLFFRGVSINDSGCCNLSFSETMNYDSTFYNFSVLRESLEISKAGD